MEKNSFCRTSDYLTIIYEALFWPRRTLAICGFPMANDNVTVKTTILKMFTMLFLGKTNKQTNNNPKQDKYKKNPLKMLQTSLLEKRHTHKYTYMFKSVKQKCLKLDRVVKKGINTVVTRFFTSWHC